jgi:hypothetical protein
MLSPAVHQRLSETVQQVCKELGIVYDPFRSLPDRDDKRQFVIFDALLWMAEYVQSECEKGKNG